MRTVRAKFQVESITRYYWGEGAMVKLSARYDSTIPEDQRFQEATPSGSMEMRVENPAALEVLELGKFFYVDFTPIEKEPKE